MLDIEVFEGGFKETELGPLPEEWEVVRLGEVAEITMGQSPPGETYNTQGIGMPFLQGKAEFGKVHPSPVKYTTNPLKIGKTGSVLISVRAPVGDVNIADMDYCIGRGLASISFKNEYGYNEYLFYCLQFLKPLLEKEGYGSTFKAINKEVLTKFQIPLPPLEEQKAIAGILSTVQSAIEKTEKVINALKNLKKSMMKHLFTYGPVAEEEAEKVELKETEIGLIPKHWEVVRVGEVFDVKQGKQLSSKESKEGKTLRPFLRTSNVLWNKIDISSISYMPFSDEEFEMLKLRRGDILVCEGGDVGRTSVWEGQLEECAYQNHLHRLRPKENNIVNYFFSYWMEYAICLRGLYVNSANRTTIPNLSAQRLKSFLIPLPPLEEQQKIAQILQSIDQRIEKEEKYKNALQNLFKSLLHNLMTGKIRVRVKSHGED
jgi:type I restriction enzyme S subunit